MEISAIKSIADRIREQVAKGVIGQDDTVDLMLTALFSAGHVLLEGPPGTAKTLLTQCFAAAIKLDFGRIQFTPDLMPGDVLGTNLFNFQTNEFSLTKGPIFTEILLADEINRTPPKTQAALLEAMQERRVTIDGETYPLNPRFTVIATQNPIEQQGTYPLPEAQLDRFLFKLVIEFPPEDIEMAILKHHAAEPLDFGAATDKVAEVLDADALAQSRDVIDGIIIDDDILAYILRLVRATRESAEISYGASTRAADAVASATRAAAALQGRDFAIPDDVKRLFIPALRHRIVLGPAAEIEGRTTVQVLENILNQIEAPR